METHTRIGPAQLQIQNRGVHRLLLITVEFGEAASESAEFKEIHQTISMFSL